MKILLATVLSALSPLVLWDPGASITQVTTVPTSGRYDDLGSRFGDQSDVLHSSGRAFEESITIRVELSRVALEESEQFVLSAQPDTPSKQGEAYDPDTDPEFQKYLRNRLFGSDHFLKWEARLPTTESKQALGLQDFCLGEAGTALTTCRAEQQCTTDDDSNGVMMDVTLEGAGEAGMTPARRQLCMPAAQVAGADAQDYLPLPTFTLRDFQRLNVTPAVSVVEPSPDTLKNFHTNVYAQAKPQQFVTELGGFPVVVRAHPVNYRWDYGDGTTLGPTPLTGGPLKEGQWDVPTATSHVYTDTKEYHVRLSTGFYGEYNIAGTGWQPVAGLNQVVSPPVAVKVWKATTRNVADDCHENPIGWGCPQAQ